MGAQAITILAILFTALIWLIVYSVRKKLNLLMPIAIPLILWFIFGTLDITTTALGVVNNPMREGNVAARWIFVNFGIWGPPLASFLWINLWVGFCVLLEECSEKFTKYKNLILNIRLVVYYSLFFGHLMGFISWYDITRPLFLFFHNIENSFTLTINNNGIISLFIILIGGVLTMAHLAFFEIVTILNIDFKINNNGNETIKEKTSKKRS